MPDSVVPESVLNADDSEDEEGYSAEEDSYDSDIN